MTTRVPPSMPVTAYAVIASFKGHDYERPTVYFDQEHAEKHAANANSVEHGWQARQYTGDRNEYRVEPITVTSYDATIIVPAITRNGWPSSKNISRKVRNLRRLADGTVIGEYTDKGETHAAGLAPGQRLWRMVQ